MPELQDEERPKSIAPSLQPKRLEQIGSIFWWMPLLLILSGSSRRFLNFILEAEILSKYQAILGYFLFPDGD